MNPIRRLGAALFGPGMLAAGHGLGTGLAALRRIHHLRRRSRAFSDQLHLAMVKSLLMVVLVAFFIGMILALQLGYELSRFSQQEAVGVAVAVAMAREMGPMMTAVLLAAGVASAMAAELGTMRVQEEVTALEVMSVDVNSYLVVPRVWALAFAAPLLTLLADEVGILGGGIIAVTQLGLDFQGYMSSALEALEGDWGPLPIPRSIYAGLLKAFVFGFTIATVGCATGLRASQGASGVGIATRTAVRASIVLIIVLNFFLGKLIYTG